MKTLLSLISACIVAAVCSRPGQGQVNSTLSGLAVVGAASAVKPETVHAEFKAVTLSNNIFTALALNPSARMIINKVSTTRRVVVHHHWISVPIPASAKRSLGVGVTIIPNPIQRTGRSVRAPPVGIALTHTFQTRTRRAGN